MKNLKITWVVIFTFLFTWVVETSGQSISPDSEVKQVILELERRVLLNKLSCQRTTHLGENDSPCCSWGGKEPSLQIHKNMFFLFSPGPLWFDARLIQTGSRKGMETRNVSRGAVLSGKASFYANLLDIVTRNNHHNNFMDNQENPFPTTDITSGGGMPPNTSFLSRPVIKLGFRF